MRTVIKAVGCDSETQVENEQSNELSHNLNNAQNSSRQSSSSSYLSVSSMFLRKWFGVLLFFSNFVYAFAEQDVQESKKHTNHDTSISSFSHRTTLTTANLYCHDLLCQDAGLRQDHIDNPWRKVSDYFKLHSSLSASMAAAALICRRRSDEAKVLTVVRVIERLTVIAKARWIGGRRYKHVNKKSFIDGIFLSGLPPTTLAQGCRSITAAGPGIVPPQREPGPITMACLENHGCIPAASCFWSLPWSLPSLGYDGMPDCHEKGQISGCRQEAPSSTGKNGSGKEEDDSDTDVDSRPYTCGDSSDTMRATVP